MPQARTTFQYGLLIFCASLFWIESTPCRSIFTTTHAYFYSGGINFTIVHGVPTTAACGLQCSRDPYCRSMMYTPSTSECRTYPHILDNLPSSGSIPAIFGELVKVEGSCKEGWMFEGCITNADCASFTNSICYEGVCRCQHGYSYSFRTDSCVDSCQQYGTKYTEIPYYLVGLNMAQVSANNVSEYGAVHGTGRFHVLLYRLAAFVTVLLTSHSRAVQVKLVGGRDQYEGTVLISDLWWNWGTICDDGFDSQDATVICRMLGYSGSATAYSYAHFGQGSGRIVLDNLACTGLETDINQCSSNGWGVHNCEHYEDAGVRCHASPVCNPRCQNGGTCVSAQTCRCRPGTHGRHCEVVDPVCNPGCQNGGTCIADQTCSCPPKVHGRHCEIDVPICTPGCENGGTCIADQTCTCQPGYYGQWCEAGGDVSAKYLPQLNTSLPLQDFQHLMSWYNVPETSDYDRACYAKIHFQGAALDTLVTAESSYSGQLFGTYSEGPIDAHSHLNGTSRVACLQVKCPGSSMNGTTMDVNVNVTTKSKYKTCVLRNHTNLSGFSHDSSNSFAFTLEAEHNYGSTFGIYIGMGFRDKANHIARQSCLSGRRFDLTHINPALGAMADLICS